MHPDLRDLPSVVPEPWLNITGQVVEAELTRRMAKATLMIEAGTYGPEESSLGQFLMLPILAIILPFSR
jgi:hypothetical protein